MLLRFIGLRLFSPESTGATATPPPTGSDPGTPTPGDGDPGKVPASSSGDSPSTTDKTFTQADLDRIVKERLADATRRAEAKRADDKRAADEKALEASGEWQKIAEARASELESLKAPAAQAVAYAKLLNAQASAEIADWPEEVKALDPGEKDVEARMAWLAKSRPLAKRLAALPKAPESDAGKGNAGGAKTPATKDGEGKGKFRFTTDRDVSW